MFLASRANELVAAGVQRNTSKAAFLRDPSGSAAAARAACAAVQGEICQMDVEGILLGLV